MGGGTAGGRDGVRKQNRQHSQDTVQRRMRHVSSSEGKNKSQRLRFSLPHLPNEAPRREGRSEKHGPLRP